MSTPRRPLAHRRRLPAHPNRRLAAALALLLLAAPLLGASGFPDVAPASFPPASHLLGGPGVRELTPGDLAPGTQLPFPPGERLVYAVSYLGVPVGHAAIVVERLVEAEGERYAHLVATARTNEFFDRLYRVDDRTEAWIRLADGRVDRTRTWMRHGGKETREEVRFDWDTHFVHVRRVKEHAAQLREVGFDFGPFVHDVFDAFFALRRVPWAPGVEVELPVYASRKVHGFRVKALREATRTSPVLGAVEALELLPLDTVDGEPEDVGRGRVFVTRGAPRVPFLVEGWFRATRAIRIGGVRAELVERTPPDPAWPTWQPPPWRPPPLAPDSADGRPLWDAPPAVRAAREASGTEAYERKTDLPAPGDRARLTIPSAASR